MLSGLLAKRHGLLLSADDAVGTEYVNFAS